MFYNQRLIGLYKLNYVNGLNSSINIGLFCSNKLVILYIKNVVLIAFLYASKVRIYALASYNNTH